MILRLAWRSLAARPVRSVVLAGGFGLGVAVMAALLGIGAVILEQARAPALVGGGDVVIGSASGRLSSALYILSSVLGEGPLGSKPTVAAPSSFRTLYLVEDDTVIPVRARGGIPSLERALSDPETAALAAWTDTPADRAWVSPDPETVLRTIDRFHRVPNVPSRAQSWAEWLYFNGVAGPSRFYLTFLAGPVLESGRRVVGVRLQLERDGRMSSYSDSVEVEAESLLQTAPDVTAGRNRIRLVGREYRIAVDLPEEAGSGRASGELVLSAPPGRSIPPYTVRGAGGWVSGYVVPVTSGPLAGALHVDGERVDFAGGVGYHDHNWGFWEGVTWQWGQVQGPELSFVYGRIQPPADVAAPDRMPAVVVALGSDGPVGFSTDVTIAETNDRATGAPQRILVRARGESLDLTMDLTIEQRVATRTERRTFGGGTSFLQLRATYHVSGHAAGREVEFTAAGSAETFRGDVKR